MFLLLRTSGSYTTTIPFVLLSFFLIFLISLSLFPSVYASSFPFPSSSSSTNSDASYQLPPPSTAEAMADAMNSVAFLKHLVRNKRTSDEIFYVSSVADTSSSSSSSSLNKEGSDGETNVMADEEDTGLLNEHKKTNHSPTNIPQYGCEYTGKLWFALNKRIRFRETVQRRSMSSSSSSSTTSSSLSSSASDEDSSSVTLELRTYYQRNERWVDCALIVCRFGDGDDDDDGGGLARGDGKRVRMEVEGKVLGVTLPWGLAGTVKEKIVRTFRDAAEEFLGGVYGNDWGTITSW